MVITATPIDDFGHKVFTTLDGRNGPDCTALLAAEIVMASASAPTYFPPAKPANSERAYVDGGLWANSPATVGILAAHRIKNIPFRSMRLLSVGNGKLPSGATLERFSSLRLLSLTTVDAIFELMFSAQESFADDNANLLLGHSNVIAANAALDKEIALDDVQVALTRLPPLAEKEADRTKEVFGDLFVSTASADTQGTTSRRTHAPSADHLVSRDLIRAAGLTAFYPARKYYGTHRREAESISAYVGTARKTIAMVSVNLMTGLPFDDLTKTLRGKLTDATSITVIVSLLDPRATSLMNALCPALDMEPETLSSMIFESLEKLISLRDTVPPERRHSFQIRVHKSIPFGSAILLDVDEPDGRIQIETKPYKVPSQRSFGFEVMRTCDDGLYESLLEGYRELIRDGEEVGPTFIEARSKAGN